MESVLKSRLVSEPLRLLECSPVSDGAAAIVLTRDEQNVKIIGSSVATDSLALAKRKVFHSLPATKIAVKNALKMADIKIENVDLVEVHDCFTIAEIVALEDLGFYAPGKAKKAALKDETSLKGKLPVNTSGGLKACGHPIGATGIKQLVELTLQLQSEAGERQIKNVHIGLAHNIGGSGGTAVIHILKGK